MSKLLVASLAVSISLLALACGAPPPPTAPEMPGASTLPAAPEAPKLEAPAPPALPKP